MRLLCLGYGYCAARTAEMFGGRFESITGTSRNPKSRDGVNLLAFDGGKASPALADAVHHATHMLVSAAPTASGDPFLSSLTPALAAAPNLQQVVYLSSLGVYGDHQGAWIDETVEASPLHARGRARLEAERGWQAFGAARGTPVAVLRLAGIYGPGQNMLVRLREGRAHRLDKPGHVFNRIHVDDIATATAAAMAGPTRHAIYNVTDDEPASPEDVIVFAASLLGIPEPPALPFDVTNLSPMAASFYGESKRVSNVRLKTDLHVNLRYPTFRDGLRAIAAAG